VTLRRHSVRIAGHATSVSIEDAFWDEIQKAAIEDGISTTRLIERVDRSRMDGTTPGAKPSNLSSALRIYVLTHLRGKIGKG